MIAWSSFFAIPEYSLGVEHLITSASYLGGQSDDSIEAAAIDDNGMIYLFGNTESADFPVDASSAAPAGLGAFLTKVNPTTNLIVFSRFFPGLDAIDIAVGDRGSIFLMGRADVGFPTTVNSYNQIGPGVVVLRIPANGIGFDYSTYIGDGADQGGGIAVNADGCVVITGRATAGYPTTPGAFSTTNQGLDVFVTKLSPDGSGLVYSTFVGGGLADGGIDLVLDEGGNACVFGYTKSPDFPTVSATQPSFAGGAIQDRDACVFRLNSDGSQLLFSTFLGGSGDEGESEGGITMDHDGNIYVGGITDSLDFPVSVGSVQSTLGGQTDLFLARFDRLSNSIAYSTLYGGSGDEFISADLTVTDSQNVYVVGTTISTDLTLVDPIQASTRALDLVIVGVDQTGANLRFASSLGGSEREIGNTIVASPTGEIIVAGKSTSDDFGVVAALQSSFGGPSGGGAGGFQGDGLIARLRPVEVDLSVDLQINPRTQLGEPLTAVVSIRNSASTPATGVEVDVGFDSHLSANTAITSQGTLAMSDHSIVAVFSTVPPNQSVLLEIEFDTLATGSASVNASVSALEIDTFLGDNQSVQSILIVAQTPLRNPGGGNEIVPGGGDPGEMPGNPRIPCETQFCGIGCGFLSIMVSVLGFNFMTRRITRRRLPINRCRRINQMRSL